MSYINAPGSGGGGGGTITEGTTPTSGFTDGYALTSVGGVVGEAPIRAVLTGNLDLYYSSSGNTTNLGTSGSPLGPTIQDALNVGAARYDVNGWLLNFLPALGAAGNYAGFTFPEFVSTANQPLSLWGIGVVRVVGDTTDATKIVLNAVGNPVVPAIVNLLGNNTVLCVVDSLTSDASALGSGIKNFVSTATGQNGIVAGNFDFTTTLPSSGLIIKNGDGASSTIAFDGSQQGHIDVSGSITIDGTFGEVFHAEQNALVTTGVWNVTTVTVANGTSFGGFATAGDDNDIGSGIVQFQNVTFIDNGSTGKRFNVQGSGAQVSVVPTNGGLATLPGNVAGTVELGGSYFYFDSNSNAQQLVGNLGGTGVTRQTYTVAQLPSPNISANNFTLIVTDANSPVVGNQVAGGGATTVIVWWDNIAGFWRVLAIGSAVVPGATLIVNHLTSGINSGSASPGTSVDVPAGSLIVAFVGAANPATATITALIDSAGNTYTQAVQSAGGSSSYFNSSIWYCSNTTFDLPMGGTFTAVTSVGQYVIAAAFATAINGLDKTNANSAGTGMGISVSTSTLTQAHEILFAVSYPSNSVGTFTEASGWTSLVPIQAAGSDGDFAFQVVNATTAVTYAPTWTSSTDATAVIASFKY